MAKVGIAAGKKRAETYRLKRLVTIESQFRLKGFQQIAGVDEAGRGPLAGPVVAAACILKEGCSLRGINDSKKLTEAKRYSLYQDLILHPDVYVGIGIVEATEIDRLNIHFASLEAMVRAVYRLPVKPDFLLIDGKYAPQIEVPSESVVNGDRKSLAIAAASIIAKVTRDLIMIGYHDLYPAYGFKDHKGYGTPKHYRALEEYGHSPIHRCSFKGVKSD